ncbi:unnamed protein product [Mucor hiemalis]
MSKKNYLDRDSGIVTTETEFDMEQQQRPTNYIFSDDDDDMNQVLNNLGDIHNIPQQQQQLEDTISTSYYTSLADGAVISIRHHIKESSQWKKVLKHKSGTTVYMSQNNVEKTALFRGELIIQGFTPQSIFYVIGMRKLWDEQFDEGNLIENLNDTTSLTYESYKSTTTSKAYDLTLVEKIECSSDGEILFACTSVDTPKVPKVPSKNRHQVKLQGWILKQLPTTPVSTKVTYITQENIKGWIPGLTKKSLARKPLIIASIDNYLKKKSDRLRLQQSKPSPQSASISTLSTNTSHPNNRQQLPTILQHHDFISSQSSELLQQQASPTLGPSSSIEQLDNDNKKINNIILSNPPPRISSLSSLSHTKHITFADDLNQRSASPMSSSAYTSSSSSSARSSYETEEGQQQQQQQQLQLDLSLPPLVPSHSYRHPQQQQHSLSPIHETPPSLTLPKPITKHHQSSKAVAGTKLYPSSRHRNERKECIEQLKTYAHSDISEWKLIGEKNNRTKLYSKSLESGGNTLPILRSDSTFYGSWTPEQICSIIQCFGARKVWDEYFEDGHVVERFSQKEYLVYMQMKSIFPIQSRDFSILTCIESNVSNGTIYVASTSVSDELIRPTASHHIRGSFMTYGWMLEPLRSPQQKRLIGVKTTFIAHLDMGGTTPLPPSIARLLTTEVPSCVDRIQNYLRQNGCPPYIRRVAGKITLETFDDKEKQYQIEYIAKHSPSARQYRSRNSTTVIQTMWCTDLRTHLSMYPFGYTVETQPEFGIRVEMRPDGMGFRIYTEKEDMDGQTIGVLIRQNRDCSPGGKPLFSWNGTPLIDSEGDEVCAEADVVKKVEKTAVTNFEQDQHVTTTTNSVHHMETTSEQIVGREEKKSNDKVK